MLEMTNSLVRDLFERFYLEMKKPSIKLLTDEMGVSYFSFSKWRNNKIVMSEANLMKIVNYIQEHKQSA